MKQQTSRSHTVLGSSCSADTWTFSWFSICWSSCRSGLQKLCKTFCNPRESCRHVCCPAIRFPCTGFCSGGKRSCCPAHPCRSRSRSWGWWALWWRGLGTCRSRRSPLTASSRLRWRTRPQSPDSEGPQDPWRSSFRWQGQTRKRPSSWLDPWSFWPPSRRLKFS